MKRFVVLLGLGMLGSVAAADRNKVLPPAEPAALVITSRPVPLNKDNPKQTRVGELVYRGGLELRSANKDFGGISDFRILNKKYILAVSDAGSWISFSLIEKKNRLVGIKGIAIAPILDTEGKAGTKKDRDAEGLAILPDKTLVTFEGSNSIWTFLPVDAEKLPTLPQKSMAITSMDSWKLWPVNGGPEAFDARLNKELSGMMPMFVSFVIAEDAFAADGTTAGELEDGETAPLRYLPPTDFKPTATSLISNDKALVLHRHFSPSTGVAATIAIQEGLYGSGVLSGREIARLEPPLTVDNMEGIDYIEREGRKYIYIISDDNFSGLQRTLLMKFEWMPVTRSAIRQIKKPAG
jgi:hypothetical protein